MNPFEIVGGTKIGMKTENYKTKIQNYITYIVTKQENLSPITSKVTVELAFSLMNPTCIVLHTYSPASAACVSDSRRIRLFCLSVTRPLVVTSLLSLYHVVSEGGLHGEEVEM